jgi:signal transduction histidine kinase/CheY-like chemotaxis protein
MVISACSPFERHAMLRSMVDQVADQLERVVERELAATELAAARDAAMEASRLKSEFLAMMSHEIRTPMNGVIGLNEVLLRTDLDEHQHRLARGVQVAGQSLLGLINDLLDFSKIEAGELELEVVDFDVAPVFEQAAAILSAHASDKELELRVDLADDVPPRLVGDPIRFGQIVSNLMSNAVKFTGKGGVTARASVADRDGDRVTLRVEVSDTGIGIAPEVQQRLFEPFRQADASTTRTFGGTGLGLAIVKQLVGAFGGEIGLDSELGEGSTFWFTARFRTAEAGSRSVRRDWASPTPQAPMRRGHVLVVEDNEINQLVALGLLETLGYTADLAANGEEAVTMALDTKYDAVLMDVQMPGMDGYAASRLIRSQEPEDRRVPIIAMTASAIDGERERCLAAGMDDFLTKPVDTGRLEAVLAAHSRDDTAAEPLEEPMAELAEMPESIEPPVDLGRLQELLSLGESAVPLVDRAIANFVNHLPQHLEDLHDAVMTGDGLRLRDLAHRLRGSALNLGATRVAAATWELESHGDADTPEQAGPALHELREAAAEAVVVLSDYRCGRVAG